MKRIFTLIFIATFCIYSSGQGLFKTKIANSLEEDIDFKTNEASFGALDEEYNVLVGKVEALYDYEKNKVTDFFTQIRSGQEGVLSTTIKDTVIVEFIKRNKLEVDQITNLCRRVQDALVDSEGLQQMYQLKELMDAKNNKKVFPFDGNLGFELKFYDLQDKDRILALGARDISFGKEIGYAAKDTRVYLNNTSMPALKTMSYALQKDSEIEKVVDKRGTRFYLVEGSDMTTGIENIKFTKVFFRNGIHDYNDFPEFLTSLKKSITTRSQVFIRTVFSDECLGQACDQLLSRAEYDEMIIDLELTELEYASDINNGSIYHFFKYGSNVRSRTKKRR